MKEVHLRHLYKLAVLLKEQGNKFYNELAERTPNVKVKNLYYKLAKEQDVHRQLFKDTLSQWEPITTDDGLLDSLAEGLREKGIFKNPPSCDAREEDVIKYAREQEIKIINSFIPFEEFFPEEWKKTQMRKLLKIEREYEKVWLRF